MSRDLHLVSTCPGTAGRPAGEALEHVRRTARWCEEAGHEGLLVYADHRLLDPWVLAQAVLESTARLRPMITLQPVYLHPYVAAGKISSLALLYGRAPDVVLAAGGNRADLLALEVPASHDDRYRRLVEYGRLVGRLLTSTEPIAHEGDFYGIHQPAALPPVPAALLPRWFLAATSEAGRSAARALATFTVAPLLPDGAQGPVDALRVGLVARETAASALAVAAERFPASAARRLEQRLAMHWSDSRWQQDLEALGQAPRGPYDLTAFRHGHAQVPCLVGDYRTVARALVPSLQQGCRWLLLDVPAGPEDLVHVSEVVRRACSRAASPLALTC